MDFYSGRVRLHVAGEERIKLHSALLSCFRIGAETFDTSLQVSCPDKCVTNTELH